MSCGIAVLVNGIRVTTARFTATKMIQRRRRRLMSSDTIATTSWKRRRTTTAVMANIKNNRKSTKNDKCGITRVARVSEWGIEDLSFRLCSSSPCGHGRVAISTCSSPTTKRTSMSERADVYRSCIDTAAEVSPLLFLRVY